MENLNNMAVSTSLTVSYASSSLEQSIQLEQREWTDSDKAIKTRAEIAELYFGTAPDLGIMELSALSNFEEIEAAYVAQCADGDQAFIADIYLYPFPLDLSYNLVASYGTLSAEPLIELATKEESITVSLSNLIDFGKLIDSVTSVSWEGNVYDHNGNVLDTAPSYTVNQSGIEFDKVVFGVCRVVYQLYRHMYSLTITPRPDAEENASDSTVMAFYADADGTNQITTLNITPLESSSEQCDEAATYTFTGPDQPVPVKFIVYDYCTGDLIADAVVQVGSTIVPESGEIDLMPGEHSIKVTASGYLDNTADDFTDNDTVTVDDPTEETEA